MVHFNISVALKLELTVPWNIICILTTDEKGRKLQAIVEKPGELSILFNPYYIQILLNRVG